MAAKVNRQWRLARHPQGWPVGEDFEWTSGPAPEPGPGQVLVESLYLSVDPYMRGRMRASRGYADPVPIGGVLVGEAVGRVVASRQPGVSEGDIVAAWVGWQDYAVIEGASVRPVDPALGPISMALGVLGMPGATAYFGLLDVGGAPGEGQTVFVSGAAGAVGSVVGQIAKLRGCRVVGSAGSARKVAWLTDELGFDSAFDYKAAGDLRRTLGEHCPDGIDCYFDNVGGPLTDAVFLNLAMRARVVVCGQISQYNLDQPELGPRLLGLLVPKRARVEGFLVFDYAARYAEALEALAGWVASGQVVWKETVVDGLENAPDAFLGMMRGDNLGKMIVRVADG